MGGRQREQRSLGPVPGRRVRSPNVDPTYKRDPKPTEKSQPRPPYDAQKARQEAGLAALVAIARQVSLSMATAETVDIPSLASYYGSANRLRQPRGGSGPEARGDGSGTPGQGRGPLARLRTDHLIRNSLYLMFSSGVQAALGFTFWILIARLFSPEDVGRASSLISATGLIAYFSLFGLNSALMRFLPTARNRNSLITSTFLLAAGAAMAIGLCYVLLTPLIASRLDFVEHSFSLTAGFLLLSAGTAVNLLTDSVFIAARKANFCALTDGVVGGISKIVLGVALAGSGAYGLFCASAGGFAAAALVSLVIMLIYLHWQPSLKRPVSTLRPLLGFSLASYVANSMNLLPSVVVPLIALDRLGARAAGYYFVAFQMAALLYAAVYAVEQSFMAEGSQPGADWRAIRRRSRKLAVMLFVPAGAILALAARWILLVFGTGYSQNGTAALELLAVAVIPIAACNWSWSVFRLAGRLPPLVLTSIVYSCAICGVAWLLAPHGLTAMAAAWPIGAGIAAILASIATTAGSEDPRVGLASDALRRPRTPR